ncbi:PE-PGRS family protein PE_PGRS5-like [Aphidius gifuensis]|uniref:PE-PGRS family protein PE_PGRS5-like n=1 Tax=Aphidius gifuensis TaxID=684658 RepID=UPI001CDC5023|nr:PE-PGRS family protein PE_PGRS5-like [Aphidius gifuensis]
MAQRPRDIISTMRSNELAREKEEANRTRRRADLARRHEQARAQLYLIEEEFIQEGYDVPGTALDEVIFENNNNIDQHADDDNADDRGDLGAAVNLNDDPGDAIARREEMLRGVPVGGIAGVPVHRIARVGRRGGGDGRLRGENTGRGNAGAYGGYGGRAVAVNPGQMPVDDSERFRYWRKQYFKSILSGGDGGSRRQGREGRRGGTRGGGGAYNSGKNVFFL